MDDLEKLQQLKEDIKGQYSYNEFIEQVLERFEDSFEDIDDVYFELSIRSND